MTSLNDSLISASVASQDIVSVSCSQLPVLSCKVYIYFVQTEGTDTPKREQQFVVTCSLSQPQFFQWCNNIQQQKIWKFIVQQSWSRLLTMQTTKVFICCMTIYIYKEGPDIHSPIVTYLIWRDVSGTCALVRIFLNKNNVFSYNSNSKNAISGCVAQSCSKLKY